MKIHFQAVQLLGHFCHCCYAVGRYVDFNPAKGVKKPKGKDEDIDPLMKKIDIPYRTFDQTRHTYASLLLQAGERPHYISKQMGHANLHVTLTRYVDFIPNEDDGQILLKVTEKLHRSVFSEDAEDCNDSES